MQMRGELAIAYWNDKRILESFEQMMKIHDYLYANRLNVDENYKLLELKLGVCVQQYHYYLLSVILRMLFISFSSSVSLRI